MSLTKSRTTVMASNEYEDFDDFEMDDFGDDDEGGFNFEPPKDEREPVVKIAGGFVEGVKSTLTDPSNQARMIRSVLPEGYNHAISMVDGVVSNVNDLYRTAKDEAKPVIKDLKKGVKRLLPAASSVLPKKMAKALEDWSVADEDNTSAYKKIDPEENEVVIGLGSIFNKHLEAQKQRDEEAAAKSEIKDITATRQANSTLAQLGILTDLTRRTVDYQDQVTANYQRKSLELQYRTYFTNRKLLNVMEQHLELTKSSFTSIAHNTSLPDIVKYTNHEKMIDELKSQIFGKVTEPASQWYRGMGQRIVKKAKGEIKTFFSDIGGHINDSVTMVESAQDQMNDARDMLGEDGMRDLRLNMAGNTLGSLAAQKAMDKLIKPLKEKIAKQGFIGASDYALMRKITTMPMRARDFANSSTEESGMMGTALDALKSVMGRNNIETMVQRSGVDELDKQTFFNNKSKRTLEEVIPGLLSKILKETQMIRTGDQATELETFNFETGRFERQSQTTARLKQKLVGKRNRDQLNGYANQIMKGIDPDGAMLSPPAAAALRKYIIELAYDRKHFDPVLLVNEYKFPSSIPREFKNEIINAFSTRYKVDASTIEYDDDNNIKGDPFAFETENQKELVALTNRYAALYNYMPDPMKDTLQAARLGQGNMMEDAGFLNRSADGTELHLNRKRMLEMLMDEAPDIEGPMPQGAPPKKKRGRPRKNPPTGTPPAAYAKGGMHNTDNVLYRAEGDLVEGEGTGTSDSINARLSNREFIVNSRSVNLPGVLPLLRYINRLGRGGEGGTDLNISPTEGVNETSVIENAITKFYDSYLTNTEKTNAILTEILEKVGLSVTIGLGGVPNVDLSGLRNGAESARRSLFGFGRAARGAGVSAATAASEAAQSASEKARAKLESKKQQAIARLRREFNPEKIEQLKSKFKGKIPDLELEELIAELQRKYESMEGLSFSDKHLPNAKRGVGNIIGATPDYLRRGKDRLKSFGTKNTERARGIKDKLSLYLGDRADKLKDQYMDIWVEGDSSPRLKARAMRSGSYIDKNTNKPVKSLSDITGPVVTALGEELISQEEFATKRIFDQFGKPSLQGAVAKAKALKDKIVSPFIGIKNTVSNLLTKLGDAMDAPVDVYVKGEMDKPRLYARLFALGVYRRKEDGFVIKRLSDLKGVIEEVDGDQVKVVITLEDLKKGLVDYKGDPIRGLGNLSAHLSKEAIKLGIRSAMKVGSVLRNMSGKLGDKVKGIGNRIGNLFNEKTDGMTLSLFASTKDVVNRLDIIHALLEERLPMPRGKRKAKGKASANQGDFVGPMPQSSPNSDDTVGPMPEPKKGLWQRFKDKLKPKVSSDTDGDGDRDGSAKDQQQARDKAKAEGAERTRWQRLTDALKGGKGSAGAEGGGLFSGIMGKLPALLAGATTLLTTTIASAGKVVGWVAKLGGLLGKGMWGATKGVAKVAWGATKLLGRGLMGAARLAPAVLRVGTAFLTGPVGIALTAGYIGYKLYQYYTQENLPLNKFRMAQYGYRHDDKDNVAKIITLEQECLKIVKANPNQPAELGSGKTLSDLLKIFDVAPDDQANVDKWIAWFTRRFKPIFLGAVTELFRQVGKTSIDKADELLFTAQKREYLRRTNNPTPENNPYDVMASPFNGVETVPLSKEDVEQAFKDANDSIEKDADTNDTKVSAKTDKPKPKTDTKSWWQSTKESMSKGLETAKGVYDMAVTNTTETFENTAKKWKDFKTLAGGVYNEAVNQTSDRIEKAANAMAGVKASVLGKTPKENQMLVYKAFLAAGFSPAQAKAMTAEVGRENSYQDQWLYGKHGDPANNKVNQGFFSWQKGRRDKLVQIMQAQGLVLPSGDFKPGLESLTAMAKFARSEMENDPSYKRTKNEFLANPNIDSETAARVLGEDYIRWAINNPKYSDSGQNRRRSHLASLEKQLGVTPAAAPKPEPGTLAAASVAATNTPAAASVPPLSPTGKPNTIASKTVATNTTAVPTPSSNATPNTIAKPTMPASKATSTVATVAPTSSVLPVAYSPSSADPEKKVIAANTLAERTAKTVAATKQAEADKTLNTMTDVSEILRMSLKQSMRAADTLDAINATLARMEKRSNSQVNNPATVQTATSNQSRGRGEENTLPAPVSLSRI